MALSYKIFSFSRRSDYSHALIQYRTPVLAAAKVRSSLFAPSALVHEAIFPTNHSRALQTSINASSTIALANRSSFAVAIT